MPFKSEAQRHRARAAGEEMSDEMTRMDHCDGGFRMFGWFRKKKPDPIAVYLLASVFADDVKPYELTNEEVMPFKSEAQRRMFERAATDPDYAKERGMTQETARKFIEDAKYYEGLVQSQRHLPERVKPSGGKR